MNKVIFTAIYILSAITLFGREAQLEQTSTSPGAKYSIKEAAEILKERPFFKGSDTEKEINFSMIKIQDAMTSFFIKKETPAENAEFKRLLYNLIDDYSKDATFQKIMKKAKDEKGVRGVWNNAMLPFCSGVHYAVCIDFNEDDVEKIVLAFKNFPNASVWKKKVIRNFIMNSARKHLADKPELLKKLEDAIIPSDLNLK